MLRFMQKNLNKDIVLANIRELHQEIIDFKIHVREKDLGKHCQKDYLDNHLWCEFNKDLSIIDGNCITMIAELNKEVTSQDILQTCNTEYQKIKQILANCKKTHNEMDEHFDVQVQSKKLAHQSSLLNQVIELHNEAYHLMNSLMTLEKSSINDTEKEFLNRFLELFFEVESECGFLKGLLTKYHTVQTIHSYDDKYQNLLKTYNSNLSIFNRMYAQDNTTNTLKLEQSGEATSGEYYTSSSSEELSQPRKSKI